MWEHAERFTGDPNMVLPPRRPRFCWVSPNRALSLAPFAAGRAPRPVSSRPLQAVVYRPHSQPIWTVALGPYLSKLYGTPCRDVWPEITLLRVNAAVG